MTLPSPSKISSVNWFNWPSRFWSIGPAALETLFDAGRRGATSEAANANYDATVAAAQESLQLFTNRYRGGVDNYLQVITAQTIALMNERNTVDILRRRMDASVLLIKALGGGWDVSKLPQVTKASISGSPNKSERSTE